MSNNKQSMKLYTEKQVRQMLEVCRDSDLYEHILTFEDILKTETPIELPSDEEIREERLLQFPDSEYANRANDRLAFYCGAKFVISKIKGGKNEME